MVFKIQLATHGFIITFMTTFSHKRTSKTQITTKQPQYTHKNDPSITSHQQQHNNNLIQIIKTPFCDNLSQIRIRSNRSKTFKKQTLQKAEQKNEDQTSIKSKLLICIDCKLLNKINYFIIKKSFDLMDTWYEDIKKEYKEVYPKMKTPEEKKEFIEKFKKVVIQFNKEIDLINQNVPMLPTEYEREDLSNQIRVYENQSDELENFLNLELYKDENFNYKLFDENKRRQEAITKMNFKKNKKTGQETIVEDQHNKDFRQVALDEGNALYQEAQDRLQIIRKKISDSSEKLQSINEEILAQNYKLMEIDDLIRESQNQMVRVKDMINFFTKTFLKDKCIALMTTLMCVLCIAIILLIFLESSKGGGDETPAPTEETAAALKM